MSSGQWKEDRRDGGHPRSGLDFISHITLQVLSLSPSFQLNEKDAEDLQTGRTKGLGLRATA